MKIIWLPEGYEAAVAITDDPDNCSIDNFKKIYDFLSDIQFPTTRAVWVYQNKEFSGTPPIYTDCKSPLITDESYLHYCRQLKERGFEFCLHGASSGNNTREYMVNALNYLEQNLGRSHCYICHCKNAENLYWDTQVAHWPIQQLFLRMYTRNRCFGHVEGSPYFWGDICQQRISFVRLYRTSMFNTLKFNPSMPFHDFSKPFVNFWFSASKGYMPRLLTEENVDTLCNESGCSIVYQYLHTYVDQYGHINPEFKLTAQRIASDSRIMCKPVSEILNRLRIFQQIFGISINGVSYIINASAATIPSVQVKMNEEPRVTNASQYYYDRYKKVLVLKNVPAYGVISLLTNETFSPSKQYTSEYLNDCIILHLPMADVIANTSSNRVSLSATLNESTIENRGQHSLAPYQVSVLYHNAPAKRLHILTPITELELWNLFVGQTRLLLREHILLGRHISTQSYLSDPGKLANQITW